MAFPTSPSAYQSYKGLIYDPNKLAWVKETPWFDLTLIAPNTTLAGGGWLPPRYKKIGNIVELSGLCGNSTGMTDNSIIAILPVNFRPSGHVATVAETHNDLKTKHRLDVDISGNIKLTSSGGVSGSAVLGTGTPWISFDSLRFNVT